MSIEYRNALTQLANAKLQAIYSLGDNSEAELLKLVEKTLSDQQESYLIAVSAMFDLLKSHTHKKVPKKSGMYLKLSHGRSAIDEYLSDWGVDGPYVGPLAWFHSTYITDMRMVFTDSDEIIDLCSSSEIPLPIYIDKDKLYYDGIYYGDWEIQQVAFTKHNRKIKK